MTIVISMRTRTEGAQKKTFDTIHHAVNWVESFDPVFVKSISISYQDDDTSKSANFETAYNAKSWLNLQDPNEQAKKV